MKMYRAPRGVTLMEIIIASVIFAMVIGISFIVTMRSTNSFHQQIQEANLADKSEKMLKALEDELSDASLIASTTDPSSTGVFTVAWTAGPYWTWGGYFTSPTSPNDNPDWGFLQAEIRYKVPLRYMSQTNNPKGYAVFISSPVIARDPVTLDPLNPPTFGNDYEFRLRYGWRDNMRFVGNAEDGKLVPLQGPGLKVQSSFDSVIPSGVGKFTANTIIDTFTYPSGSIKSGYMCYRFQPDQTVRYGKYGNSGFISEYMEDIDLDGDGYKYSYFAVGYLERSYWVGDPGQEQLVPDSRFRVGESVIMQPILYGRTMDPAPSDPDHLQHNRIFNRDPYNAARLNVFLWMISMAPDGGLHFMQSKVALFMRNNASYVASSSATGTN